MNHPVATGQFWSVLTRNHVRVEAKVTRVTDRHAIMRGPGRIRLSVPISALAKGRRGARLLGKGQLFDPFSMPTAEDNAKRLRQRLVSLRDDNETEKRTASSFRKETAPRGIVTAKAADQEAYDLLSAGMTVMEIAKKLKVSDSVIRARIKRVREAKEDALLLKELGT